MKRIVLAAALLFGMAAFADVTITILSSSHKISSGSFALLQDGGWHFIVCATATTSDGGGVLLPTPCISCDPGAFSNTPSVCQSLHKDANGL